MGSEGSVRFQGFQSFQGLTSASAGQEEEAQEEEAGEEDGLEEVEALGLGLLGQHRHVHHLLGQGRQKVRVVGEGVQAVPEEGDDMRGGR